MFSKPCTPPPVCAPPYILELIAEVLSAPSVGEVEAAEILCAFSRGARGAALGAMAEDRREKVLVSVEAMMSG